MTVIESAGLDTLPLSADELQFRWELAVHERLAPMEIRLPRNEDHPTAGSFRSQAIGDLLVTDWTCPPMVGMRTRSDVENTAIDGLCVLLGAAGTETFVFDQTTEVLRPGTVVIMSSRVPARFVLEGRLRKRTLLLPRASLKIHGAPERFPDTVVLDNSRPLVRLFTDFLQAACTDLPRMTAADVGSTRSAILALVAGAVRTGAASVNESDLLPALRSQICTWIDRNLQRGPIRVEEIAAAHNVSVRTVHRAFEMVEETVGSILRVRRLAAAYNDLVNTDVPISAIAHRWGYYDASHFGREFRRVHGAPPRDYREAHGVAGRH
jgi:AraC-like DNA-binding protein